MRPQNPFQQIINEAKEFRKTFNGNPKDEVQRLLNTGAMSQAQFNQLSQIAQQIVGAMGNN
jgi:hypothetical protein